jgi:hypothetical protein
VGAVSDVPDDYEAYAAERSAPRFTNWLRARSEPAWSDAVDGRFVRELGAGTLEETAFADYLVQDYAVVDALVGAFGHAVGQAPEMAALTAARDVPGDGDRRRGRLLPTGLRGAFGAGRAVARPRTDGGEDEEANRG